MEGKVKGGGTRPPREVMRSGAEAVNSAFQFVAGLEGKWKLNQNHSIARRERVIRALTDTGGEDRQQIAGLMAKSMNEG